MISSKLTVEALSILKKRDAKTLGENNEYFSHQINL
jgi:hypothetical protein